MKLCRACGESKEDTEFYKRTLRSGKAGLQHKCKSCSTEARRHYYKPHSSIKYKLDLSWDEVEAITSIGECQGCHRTDRKLCIDHDHGTNKPRGLLCHNCNTALGLVGDNISTLANLINYLDKHHGTRLRS